MVLNNSLAAFRPPAAHQQDLAVLAQTHFQNDLTSDDRDVLVSAAATLQRYAAVGSLVGIGVGCLLAYRVRALRRNWFVEFQTRMVGRDRPRRLVFESGKDGMSCIFFFFFFLLPSSFSLSLFLLFLMGLCLLQPSNQARRQR